MKCLSTWLLWPGTGKSEKRNGVRCDNNGGEGEHHEMMSEVFALVRRNIYTLTICYNKIPKSVEQRELEMTSCWKSGEVYGTVPPMGSTTKEYFPDSCRKTEHENFDKPTPHNHVDGSRRH